MKGLGSFPRLAATGDLGLEALHPGSTAQLLCDLGQGLPSLCPGFPRWFGRWGWLLTLAVPLVVWVTMGKLSHHSRGQFVLLQNGMARQINEIIRDVYLSATLSPISLLRRGTVPPTGALQSKSKPQQHVFLHWAATST